MFDIDSALTPAWECQLTKCVFQQYYKERNPVYHLHFHFSFKKESAGTRIAVLLLPRELSDDVAERIGHTLAFNYATRLNDVATEPAAIPPDPDRMPETLCSAFGGQYSLHEYEDRIIAELLGGVPRA